MRCAILMLALGVAALACGNTVVDDAGATDDAGVQPSADCPQPGGSMMEIPDTQGGSYCIDQTEVTNAAYAAWLATNPSDDWRAGVCRVDGPACAKAAADGQPCTPTHGALFFTFQPLKDPEDPGALPTVWSPPAGKEEFPVVDVTWCDADAFCRSNGKRLCGEIGGAPFSVVSAGGLDDAPQPKDPEISEFYNAVTKAGSQAFPYGDTFEAGACTGVTLNGDGELHGGVDIHAVRGRDFCEGGFPGVFDLLGNVMEFVDGCTASRDDPIGDSCLAVGNANEGETRTPSLLLWFVQTSPAIGFRCCADVMKP